MHSYFRAIGFSKLKSKREQNILISNVLNEAKNQNILNQNNHGNLIQIFRNFGSQIGISIVGEYDQDGRFTIDHAFPYNLGTCTIRQNYFQVEAYPDKEAYLGISENYNLGISLIYFIQNIIDNAKEHYVNQSNLKNNYVRLAGLSLDGRILCNVKLEDIDFPFEKQPMSNKERYNLVAKAKLGDVDAMEILTLDEMDTYSLISKRIKNEDLYTLIDTYFMPYGINNELYSILGIIVNYKKIINVFSKELVYNITVNCNNVLIDVVIHSNDLIGELKIGRRFKGIIWLQGTTMNSYNP